ncbi:hypothetical protein BJX64DRAFT_294543 [Aspergillus heterothallicus]
MYHAASVLFKAREKQGLYTVQQIANQECPTVSSFSQSKCREAIEVTLGSVFHISGWIDTTTSETMVAVEIAGQNLGAFHGLANRGIRINLRLHLVQGHIKLELNAFDELWVHIDTVRGVPNEDFLIFDYKKSEQLQRLPGLVCEPWIG